MSKKTKIKIGERTITTTNVTANFERRFNSLQGKRFDNLQDFLQALEQTKNEIKWTDNIVQYNHSKN